MDSAEIKKTELAEEILNDHQQHRAVMNYLITTGTALEIQGINREDFYDLMLDCASHLVELNKDEDGIH